MGKTAGSLVVAWWLSGEDGAKCSGLVAVWGRRGRREVQ